MRTILLFLLFAGACHAQTIVYENSDSLLVEQILANAPELENSSEYITYFGKQLEGTPYVAKTLEKGSTENLIINLRQLDCTTFVENILALTLCMRYGKKSFRDLINYLRQIRYEGGTVAYDRRLHYFSSWIDSNTRCGFVSEDRYEPADSLSANGTPAVQTSVEVNFMTTHTHLYPALKGNTAMVRRIAEIEKSLSGKSFEYIPKSVVGNTELMRRYVKSGDIIAIVTSKKGLDISHVGIALWHSDGTLHLLNASQIHKKVIDEPMTLYQYMQKHPSQLGIRTVHIL